MHGVQRIIDLSLLLFIGVLWGIFMVFGWASPLEGSPLSPDGYFPSERCNAEASDPEGTISGRVQDDQGNPLEGAKIHLFEPGTKEPLKAVESDHLGAYRLSGLNPGLFILQAERPGFNAGRRIVMVEVDGRSTMDMTLTPSSAPMNTPG